MRILFIVFWLLVPLGLAAYHYGPGQDRIELDDAGKAMAAADQAVANENWDVAIASYQKALSILPEEKAEMVTKIRIEIAKAKIQNKGLPEARQEMLQLVAELKASNESASPELMEAAVETLAYTRYYMTYLMKLEGLPPTEWEPEIEAARQEYKLLAQTGSNRERHLSSLESAIRLARAEPKELYGLPIPKP